MTSLWFRPRGHRANSAPDSAKQTLAPVTTAEPTSVETSRSRGHRANSAPDSAKQTLAPVTTAEPTSVETSLTTEVGGGKLANGDVTRVRKHSYVNVTSETGENGKMSITSEDVARIRKHSYVNVPSIGQGSLSPPNTESTGRESSITESEKSSSSVLSGSVDSLLGGGSEDVAGCLCDSSEETLEENRYNRLKITHSKGGFRSRRSRMHYCHYHTDSETSSLNESSDSLIELRQREKEHYNRLKLNVTQLPSKKAMRGFRVLYEGSSGRKSHRNSHSSQPNSQSSSVTGRSRHRGVDAPDAAVSSQTSRYARSHEQPQKSSMKYRNESHMNKIHSVSGSPVVRHSYRPRSSSTGDMGKTSNETEERDTARANRLSGATRSKSFSDINSPKRGSKSKRYSGAGGSPKHTDSVADSHFMFSSPSRSRGHHNHRHNQSWQDTRYSHAEPQTPPKSDFLRNQRMCASVDLSNERPTFRDLNPETAAASSKVHTMPRTSEHRDCPITCSCNRISFIDPLVTIKCNSEGGEYKSENHDFKIRIPKGAIKKKTTIEVQIGITLHGPFHFPDAMKPVSPVLWLSANPDTKFRKPVEITLPHYIDTSSTAVATPPSVQPNASKLKRTHGLHFLRATCSPASPTNRHSHPHKTFRFQSTDGEHWFWVNENHGTLHTKHLCFLCIAANVNKEFASRAGYCLIPVIPKPIVDTSWRIHYCVTYLLKTCIQAVQQQFGEGVEILAPRKFTFAGSGKEAKLEIRFQRELPNTHWILALESDSKIRASDVDMWSYSDAKYESPGPMKPRPPQFTVRVHGEEAVGSAVAHISFTGATEEIQTEVVLPARNRSPGGTSTSPPLSLLSPPNGQPSPPHIRHCPSCNCLSHLWDGEGGEERGKEEETGGEGEGGGDYDHLPSLGELVNTHVQLTYHNGKIDIPSDQELETVAREVSRQLGEDWPLLQTPLGLPDHLMLDVLHQRTIRQQLLRMLKEWRRHTSDCSKERLAGCLRRADRRLEGAAAILKSDLSTSCSSGSGFGPKGAEQRSQGAGAAVIKSAGGFRSSGGRGGAGGEGHGRRRLLATGRTYTNDM